MKTLLSLWPQHRIGILIEEGMTAAIATLLLVHTLGAVEKPQHHRHHGR